MSLSIIIKESIKPVILMRSIKMINSLSMRLSNKYSDIEYKDIQKDLHQIRDQTIQELIEITGNKDLEKYKSYL